jgi:4-diphosphocytidyl-2-C-methyl-D-erythritol kinase
VLNVLWDTRLPNEALRAIAATLGADVPVCVESRPMRMQGIGEMLSEAPALPAFGILLANPRIALPTPAVFGARTGPYSPPAALPDRFGDAAELAAWLGTTSNDLQPAAIALRPEISEVLRAIASQPGCLLARMSGSGATCFGLFRTEAEAAVTSSRLPKSWWRWAGVTAPTTPAAATALPSSTPPARNS